MLCIMIVCCSSIDAEASEYGEDANVFKRLIEQQYQLQETEEGKAEAIQQFFIDRILYMGYQPTKLPFCNTSSEANDSDISMNLVFQRGGLRENVIVLEACYRENAVGAAVLLELANQLASQKELPYTVQFLLTDKTSEQGSEQYLSQLTQEQKSHLIGVVSFDTVQEQSGIKVLKSADDRWLFYQIQSIAKQLKVSFLTGQTLLSIWEENEIPQVKIIISDVYSQMRNAAMLMDAWIGNANENNAAAVISQQYIQNHSEKLQINEPMFYGVSVQKAVKAIIVLAATACLLVACFQLEFQRRKRKKQH